MPNEGRFSARHFSKKSSRLRDRDIRIENEITQSDLSWSFAAHLTASSDCCLRRRLLAHGIAHLKTIKFHARFRLKIVSDEKSVSNIEQLIFMAFFFRSKIKRSI